MYRTSRAQRRPQGLKAWLCRVLHWTGLTALKEISSRSTLTILTYHRVLPDEEAERYPLPQMVMPLSAFEQQMAELRKSYNVVSVREALHLVSSGRLPKRSVAVTFDDGYRDSYEWAWPVTKKYDIPFTLFVVTGVLDRTNSLWWDEMAFAVSAAYDGERFPPEYLATLPNWVRHRLSEGREESCNVRILDLVKQLNPRPLMERQEVIRRLCASHPSATEEAFALMASWEEIKEMQANGVEIGNHTVTHALLDELDPAELKQEIERASQRLEEELGQAPRYFAHPRGRSTDDALPSLKSVGIEAAVTVVPGRNDAQTNIYALHRFDAGYLKVPGGYDPSVFRCELAGWFHFLRSE